MPDGLFNDEVPQYVYLSRYKQGSKGVSLNWLINTWEACCN